MRTTPDAHRHEDASMAADVLYVSCYVDDLFILYKHDRDGSLYDKFTTALASSAGESKTRGPSPTC